MAAFFMLGSVSIALSERSNTVFITPSDLLFCETWTRLRKLIRN